MNYADSNFIFALYKELSGTETDASIYNDFFMGNKDVRTRFKEQHVWPKDDVWYKHLNKSYDMAMFDDFVQKHISDEQKNKFKSVGSKTNPDNITLASVIYTRFLLTAKETWNNDFDLLKRIVIFYCTAYELNSERIDYLKKNSFADIIYSLITEASSTRGESDSQNRTFSQSTDRQQFSILLNTMDVSEWLCNYQCSKSSTQNMNPLIRKLIARYHFLKNKLLLACNPKSSAQTLKEALDIADKLILFTTDMLDIYTLYLPDLSSDKIKPLPRLMCIGDEHKLPAFLGELYLLKAVLLLHNSKYESQNTSLLHMNYAKKYLLEAEEILSQHLETEKISLAISNNQETAVIKPLLKNVYLYRVLLYCQLASSEKHTCHLGDLCQEYILPCQKAFEKAAVFIHGSDPQYENVQKKFQSIFFNKDSNVFARIVYPEKMHPDYNKEGMHQYMACANISASDTAWLKSFQFQKENDNCDLNHTVKTAYSADFDSVLSKSPADSEQLELSIFQIVASGIAIVLQLNQITDNIAMLKLLHNPAFQVLCRKGMIVLSCYGNIMTPEKYLLSALQKEIKDFEFSSSRWFNHPKFGMQYRNLMSQCLTEQITYSHMMSELPDMIKNDLDFCYDSYRLLLELFTPSTIRQFHQNPAIRYPQVPLTKGGAITLSDAIHSRIQDLREDDEYYPIDGRQDFLDFCTLQHEKAVRAKYTTRSEYRNLIPEKEFLKQMTPQYQNYWNLFESLINYSYCASNGSRSSDHIYNTLTHDILRLHPEQSVRNVSTTDNLIIKDAFTRYRNENLEPLQASHIMSLSDLIEISMTVRRYNLENLDADKRQDNLEKNTGMKYDIAKSGDALLVDYKYRTENRVVTDVTLKRTSNDITSGFKDGIEIQL